MTTPHIVLCADDFAMTEGITRGIAELAEAGRLSATSAMVTTETWASHGRLLAALRGRIAIGLHLNLTLGTPLGAMPSLAPEGIFPPVAAVIRASLTGRIDRAEVTTEIARQIGCFEAVCGYRPDFIDGHQHVHALPNIRHALIAAIEQQRFATPPLVRNPAESARLVARRGLATTKSLILSGLAAGFGQLLASHELPRNTTFSGVSAFDRASPYASELARALSHPGQLHVVMCHPGYPDATLARIDPVVDRRRDELDALLAYPDLPSLLWHPNRATDGPPIDWRQL